MVGYLSEYEAMLDMLKEASAELKLVIPGNHDITLHEDFYVGGTGKDKHVRRHGGAMEDVQDIRKMWTGEEARKAGIVYLDEGVRTFELGNGARFTVSDGSPFLRVHGEGVTVKTAVRSGGTQCLLYRTYDRCRIF